MKVDLHNHLGKNGANPSFDETINLVYNKLGKDFVFGICNCTSVDYRFENFTNQKGEYERVWLDDKKRILFVPEKNIYIVGCEEILSKQGHLVVVGIPSKKKIQRDNKLLSLEDALKFADDIDGIKIAVHPFGKDGIGEYLRKHEALLQKFDGWEIYNSSAELAVPGILPFNANKKSLKFYNSHLLWVNYNIGACAFTDGHSVGVMGKSYTIIPLLGRENFMFYLKKGIKSRFPSDVHTEPAKWDAFKHSINMVKHKVFKTEA